MIDRSLDELRQRELVPFVAAIEAGTRLVMTSHILLPQLDAENPATMSRAILTGLLREELGFAGVIVSDALDMAGAASPGAACRRRRSAPCARAATCSAWAPTTPRTRWPRSRQRDPRRRSRTVASTRSGSTQAAGRVRALADDLAASRRR